MSTHVRSSFLQYNIVRERERERERERKRERELKRRSLILSCQLRVTEKSCFVYKVIRNLESIYHFCINSIRSDISFRVSSSGVFKVIFYLIIVNKHDVTATLGWQDSRCLLLLHYIQYVRPSVCPSVCYQVGKNYVHVTQKLTGIF